MAALASKPLKAPPNAVTFGIVRMIKPGERNRKGKCVGEPSEDGTVPDRFDVAEFSPQKVLETWGPDNYRVDWYDADGKRISSQTFQVAHPTTRGPAIEPRRPGRPRGSRSRRDPDDEDDDRGYRRDDSDDRLSLRDFMAMQAEQRREEERRQERADERHRQEFAQQQQRDREFMATMVGALMQTRAAPEQSTDMIRREVSLEIRQGLHNIRRELLDLQPEEEPEERDPPEDLGEGVARVGAAIMTELEERAPHLVNELIPAVSDWLKQRGFTPSPQMAAVLQRPVVNGRGNAGQS